MNKFSKLFLAFAASTMMLSSCNSDEPGAPDKSGSEGGFHATLTLSLPAGSRSQTVEPGDDDPAKSNAGFEVGNEKENNVGAAIVLLASYDKATNTYSYITSKLADAVPSTATSDPVYNLTFDSATLADYAETEVYVFAYCNPTTELINELQTLKSSGEKDFADLIGDISKGAISGEVDGKGQFLMTNATVHSVTLPSQELMESTYDKPEKAYDLGTIRVERATARFDFRETTYTGETTANYYPVKDVAGNTMAYVQLDGMTLINEALNYYYLPRVSTNGKNVNVTICGQETPSNYVVSPFANEKIAPSLNTEWISENYRYTPTCVNVGTADEPTNAFDFTKLTYTTIANFKGLGEDNDDNWTVPDGYTKTGYHIWQYVAENTIPEVTLNDIAHYQRKGVTTGVVFKGHLVGNGDNALAAVINAGTDVIYAYGNVLYGNLEMLKNEVLANPVSSLAETFKAAYGITETEGGESIEDQVKAVTADLEKTTPGGFAIYRPTDGQYVMYYSYWNRHNDNGKNTIMRGMEFSVVRNNVYKLAVQDIVSFGHTGNPGDDPDPDEPDDPDETPKIYFTVQVQVIPWVVRVNNIIL